MIDWWNFCRDECERYLERHPLEIGRMDDNGEPNPIMVEIDETKYFHHKYHRGQWCDGHWVFGWIQRGTGKCFLVEVLDGGGG